MLSLKPPFAHLVLNDRLNTTESCCCEQHPVARTTGHVVAVAFLLSSCVCVEEREREGDARHMHMWTVPLSLCTRRLEKERGCSHIHTRVCPFLSLYVSARFERLRLCACSLRECMHAKLSPVFACLCVCVCMQRVSKCA